MCYPTTSELSHALPDDQRAGRTFHLCNQLPGPRLDDRAARRALPCFLGRQFRNQPQRDSEAFKLIVRPQEEL